MLMMNAPLNLVVPSILRPTVHFLTLCKQTTHMACVGVSYPARVNKGRLARQIDILVKIDILVNSCLTAFLFPRLGFPMQMPTASTPPARAGRAASTTFRSAASRGVPSSAAAAPAAAVGAEAAAQLADQILAMEHTCYALNERLATIRAAEQVPEQHDEQRRERERERDQLELQRRDAVQAEANGAAAKASGLVEHYQSPQTDELRRRYTEPQAHVWEETARGGLGDRGGGAGGCSLQPHAAALRLPSPPPLSAPHPPFLSALSVPDPPASHARAAGTSSAPPPAPTASKPGVATSATRIVVKPL